MLPTPVGAQGQPVPQNLHSALAIPPDQPMQPPPQQQPLLSATAPLKRRKKDDPVSEPRRLRRSHEACARCRSKKIKCDSKHPRCTACATAGTQCNQEDRHRQTLTPRGHVEHIEHQLAQCEALLKLRYPGFTLENLDEYISRENIDPASIPVAPSLAPVYQFDGNGRVSGGAERPPKGYPPPIFQPPPPPPGYPPYHMMPPGPPYPPPYHPSMPMQPHPGPFSPHMHPPFTHPGAPYPPPPPGHVLPPPPLPGMGAPPPPPGAPPAPSPVAATAAAAAAAAVVVPSAATSASKGTDPNGNDMSNTGALAKNFGVNQAILNAHVVSTQMDSTDPEDLAVGSNGLTSGRDRSHRDAPPRAPDQWIQVTTRRNSVSDAPNTLELARPVPSGPTVEVWLPKDKSLAKHVVNTYFNNLNLHRPVFDRKEFVKIIDDLYDGKSTYDPGYICSTYLILALGTLSDLNHRAEADGPSTDAAPNISTVAQKLMPSWPQHDEFFQRALAVKPDLRVTVSSLQALILLHWYLYTERQGRTLWRLVGSLVRLSIELGLHHDPTTQFSDKSQNVFTEEESQLRIRLWGIVLIHDRGTSILLGRPLAISPSDANTPRPTRHFKARLTDFSEHFELSHPIAEIQADIINSLYTPKKQVPDTLMRNATRIIKSMSEFRRSLPERYKFYFGGTEEWPEEDRIRLVEKITEDEGLTLLKLGIARILLLRALFNNKELDYHDRRKALTDAVITSHNIIVIHNQLIRFPNIAFFTSPIPLHIAAMVILFGHMSGILDVPFNTVVEDLWLALDMLPRFRWRWERKDFGGAHPLLARLAEMVMRVNLRDHAPSNKPMLLCEKDWDDNSSSSPVAKSQHGTPTMAAAGPSSSYPHQQANFGTGQMRTVAGSSTAGSHSGSSGHSTPHTNSNEKQLVDLPNNLFYPFYPEDPRHATVASASGEQGYSHLLAQAGAAHGHAGSYESYMSEERDTAHPHPSTHAQGASGMWVTVPQQPAPGASSGGAQRAGMPVYASHS